MDELNLKVPNVCVGVIWCGDEEHSTKIEQDEQGNFLNSEKELQDWAYALNHPWSDTSTEYVVTPNYHFPGEWIAERKIIVYDDIEVYIAARADSPSEAIIACDKFRDEVIKKYDVADDDEDDE